MKNEHLKDFIKYQTRVKKYLNGIETFEQEAANISVELGVMKRMDKSKSEYVRNIEKVFERFSNDASELANRFAKGELRTWGTDDLKEELKRINEEIKLSYGLNEEYIEANGNRHPNYDKYSNCMGNVGNALDKELTERKKMLGDFDWKVF